MAKNLFETFFSRVLITMAGFIVVTLNAHYLGAEGVGTIGLIVLSVSIIQLLNSIVGSGSVVYLVSRYNVSALLVIAYLWAMVTALFGVLVLSLIPGALPCGYATDIVLLSILQAMFTVNLSIIMGRERYRRFNVLSVLQFLFILMFTLSVYLLVPNPNVKHYLHALYASGVLTFILTFLSVVRSLKPFKINEMVLAAKAVSRFGSWIQLASFFQFFNYRLNYYFIENMINRAALGVYSVGTQVSESSWIFARSIAMIQYARISNSEDAEYARKLTLALIKLTLSLTIFTVAIFLIIPGRVYGFIFTSEFLMVRQVILAMAVGILAVALSTILSHYFSGTGKPYHNAIASGIGLAATLLAGTLLIPKLGLTGAGITASIAYSSSALYQTIVFLNVSRSHLIEMILVKDDLQLWKTELQQLFSRKS